MLTTIVISECDQCRQQFHKLAIVLTTCEYPQAISSLHGLMQQDGWRVCDENYICADCDLEAQYIEYVRSGRG